ncbi:MAG TPA: GTP-binding protein [Anaerovoracaceae bacterium]|nr:GTP-binding protein [Anaerovoracaceae bacterium]
MKVKADIVAGFLGAGKTTLIKKLVTELYGKERVVIIENELGKVNIDSKIFRDSGIFVEEMTAGCICCSLGDDFMTSILKVKEAFQPDRIIVEPTGVALLSEIIGNYNYHQRKDEIELDHIIAVVDVRRFETSLFISKGFIDNQLKAAKSVVLSKIDGNNEDEVASAINYIQDINKNANIAAFDWKKASAQEIIYAVEHSADKGEEKEHGQTNIRKGITQKIVRKSRPWASRHEFDPWEAETEKLVNREKIRDAFHEINESHEYGSIVRGKGILKDSEGWYQFDFVFGDLAFRDCTADEKGKLCIIGTDLNREKLFDIFGI